MAESPKIEIDLQRSGYLSALTQPAVVDAMLSGPLGCVIVNIVEWSETQCTTVNWTVIDSPAAAYAFAATVDAQPLLPGGLMTIRGAIDYSVARIEETTVEVSRRVIEISADG